MSRQRALIVAAITALLSLGLASKDARALPIEGSITVLPYTAGPGPHVAPDPGIADDFSYASAIYDQAGITVSMMRPDTIELADGNSDGNWDAAEFHATLNNMGRAGFGADTIFAYYVPSYPAALAQAWSDEDVGGAILVPGVIVNSARNPDSVAHEIGHMLVNNWRWKGTEDDPAQNNGIHSGNANDLMASGAFRNVPTVLDNVWPDGHFDQIRNTVGYLNGSATEIVPQISAMYTLNSQITISERDTFGVGMGIVDDLGGGPTVESGDILWANEGTVTDGLRGVTLDIDASARKTAGAGLQEEFTFYYHAHAPLAKLTLLQLAVSDVDSVGTGYSGLVPDSVSINVYTDILSDAGKVALTLGPDYTFASVFDGANDDLDNFGVTIMGGVLAGINDIEVRFSLQVIPEPTSWLLLATGGVGIALAIRRRRPAVRSTVRSATA